MIVRTLSVIVILATMGACGVGSVAESVPLDSQDGTTSNIAMSLDALETMSLSPGTAVLVPLDRSVLALDADTLAEMAADGSLARLLEEFVLTEPAGESDLVDGAVLRTKSGLEFEVRIDGTGTSIGAGRLVDIRFHDGLTVIVLDDLFA